MLIRIANCLDLFHDFHKLESILKNNQSYILIGAQHFNGSCISIGKKQHKTFCKSGVETGFYSFVAQERLDLWKLSLPTLQRWLCHNTSRNNMITYSLKSNQKNPPSALANGEKYPTYPSKFDWILNTVNVCSTAGCHCASLHPGSQTTQPRDSLPLFKAHIPCILRACWDTGEICQQVAYFGWQFPRQIICCS